MLALPVAAVAEPRTLQEVLAYARQHAPRVEARRAERDRLRAEARVRGFWLPQAPTLSGEWAERTPPGESQLQDRVLEGTLLLEPFGQGFLRAHAASQARREGLNGVDAVARGWAAEVAWRYHEVLRRRWMGERARLQVGITTRLAEVVQRRFDAGDASGLDLDLARVEAAEGRIRLLESERGLREAEENLAAAMGWPIGQPLPALDSLALVPTFPDTSALLAQALRQRPELLIARAALDRGRAETRLASLQLLPEVEVGVFGGRDEGDDIGGVRVGLTIPFLGPPLADRGARSAESRRLEAELRAAERDAHADIAVAREAVSISHRETMLFLDEILPGIQEARQRYAQAYAVGQTNLTSVLLSEQRYREAENSFAEALGRYIDALRELENATGLPVLSGYELGQEEKP